MYQGIPRRNFLLSTAAAGFAACGAKGPPTVVLTFDDAVQSHHDFVAPLLKDLGFGATFFVSHRWMDDADNFMDWEDIARIHQMGFEIGNHSWSHSGFASPRIAARIEGELALVDNALAKVEVPKPVSFAWCGNHFGPEALAKLRGLGYRYARRGMQPEVEYGKMAIGPTFDPAKHDPLLIPTTGDAYPDWTLEHFQKVIEPALRGGIVVVQFHGVPDVAHPWVHTPPERFQEYMEHLRKEGARVIAMRDLESLMGADAPRPEDPLVGTRYPEPKAGETLELPIEVEQTRADLGYWMANMLTHHRYTNEEAGVVAGMSASEVEEQRAKLPAATGETPRLLPYPGGRHPRIGFLEGAIDPLRGPKASIFLPWNPEHYVLIDLPELITSSVGHQFLAHTHVPTIWKDRNVWIDNVDWQRHDDGHLTSDWTLPNKVGFGAAIRQAGEAFDLELWVRNGTEAPLAGLRTQLCVMLKGAPDFNEQTKENKILEPPVAAVRSRDGKRWILTAWQRTGRSWGNDNCPCMHADPVFEDCPVGKTVRLRGRLWFFEGEDVSGEIAAAKRRFQALSV